MAPSVVIPISKILDVHQKQPKLARLGNQARLVEPIAGVTHLRSLKMTQLHYDEAECIQTISPYGPAAGKGLRMPAAEARI